MKRFRHPIAKESAHLHLNKIRFSVVAHKWSAVVLMLHEMNVDAETLLEALKTGHGLAFDPADDPTLYFILDDEMRRRLYDSNFRDPTDAQLVATSRSVGLTEKDAREKFVAQFMGDQN